MQQKTTTALTTRRTLLNSTDELPDLHNESSSESQDTSSEKSFYQQFHKILIINLIISNIFPRKPRTKKNTTSKTSSNNDKQKKPKKVRQPSKQPHSPPILIMPDLHNLVEQEEQHQIIQKEEIQNEKPQNGIFLKEISFRENSNI